MTPGRRRVLEAIAKYFAAESYAPSMRDLCALTGTSSTNAINDALRLLERDGYIERKRRQGRALRLTEKARALLASDAA